MPVNVVTEDLVSSAGEVLLQVYSDAVPHCVANGLRST